MSNKEWTMERTLNIEGFLYIPPHTIVKNPSIKFINGKITKIERRDTPPFHEKGCLFPPLVNAHVHLDFPHPIYSTDFVSWIEKIILKENSSRGYTKKTIKILNNSRKLGILHLCDITRELEYPLSVYGCQPFYEIIGDEDAKVPELPEGFMLSPHAVYSTSPRLIKEAKKRFKNRLFMMHASESKEEVKLVQGKPNQIEERIYPLVKRKKPFDGVFPSPIALLEHFSLLDEKMILVHCIEATPKDIELIARRGSKVVICPRSNLYLNGGMADVPAFIREGITVAIGTDGLGSTPNLNLWEEARLLYLYFKGKIKPEKILEMLTVNGLNAVGRKPFDEATFLLFDIKEPKGIEELAFTILFQAEELIKRGYFKGKELIFS